MKNNKNINPRETLFKSVHLNTINYTVCSLTTGTVYCTVDPSALMFLPSANHNWQY